MNLYFYVQQKWLLAHTPNLRPFAAFGPSQPIFPVGVKCSSFEDAEEVVKLEDAIKDLDWKHKDGRTVTQMIFTIPGILDLLSYCVAFILVVYGEKQGIYEDWYIDLIQF